MAVEKEYNLVKLRPPEPVGQYRFSINGKDKQSIFEIEEKPQIEPPSKEIRSQLKIIGRQIPPVPEDWPDPQLTENGSFIAKKNYLKRSAELAPVETEKEMFFRIAHNIACPDAIYGGREVFEQTREEFYHTLANLEFIPNTPTLSNAGGELQQLSACFVLPIPDDLEGISQTLKDMIMIHKTGGGTGFSFSRLRPMGAIIKSTGRESSGPVHFMWAYADITYRIKQGGLRRGANMGVMDVTHPDILRWIVIKSDEHMLNPFNLSVALTNEFMEQVEKDSKFAPEGLRPYQKEVDILIGKIQESLLIPYFDKCVEAFEDCVTKLEEFVLASQPGEGYELTFDGKTWKKYNARKVFDLIARLAWEKGEPGVVYMDRINEDNPTPHLGKIESTNPCGEQPLLPYESCNLGSVNLALMVKDGEIDYEKLRRVTRTGVHFLDNVIDMNQFPLLQIEEMTLANRKIGLGVMGFADMLAQLKIPYDSEESLEIIEKVMGFIREEARKASGDLAKERGPFPNFEDSIFDEDSPNYKGLPFRLRNAAIVTIAPTGTISMLADVSSGIEPFFALLYKKSTVKGKVKFLNPHFVKIAKEEGFWSDDLESKIKANGGSVRGLREIPEHVQRLFTIASEITPEWHIKVQAAFQRHVDNAISKTINMPNTATPEDIQKTYLLAFQLGCKGVTIYREGSREVEILERKKERPKPVRERLPDERRAIAHKFEIGGTEGYIHVGLYDDGRPGEVFITIAKEGSTVSGLIDWAAVLTSVALQYGVPVEDLVRKFKNTRFEPMGRTNNSQIPRVTSIPDYIFRWLELKFVPEDQRGNGKNNQELNHEIVMLAQESSGMGCPDCGQVLVYQEGCLNCMGCGYTKCG